MSYRKERHRAWMGSAFRCKDDFDAFIRRGLVTRARDSRAWRARYLEKANHNLDFASLLEDLHKTVIKERFPNKAFHDWATVAFYYAIYHAALALVANAGYRSKSHMATLCGVIRFYYHAEGSFSREHVETLARMERADIDNFVESAGLRERASYGTTTSFEERLASLARKDAISFVNKARRILT